MRNIISFFSIIIIAGCAQNPRTSGQQEPLTIEEWSRQQDADRLARIADTEARIKLVEQTQCSCGCGRAAQVQRENELASFQRHLKSIDRKN